MIFYHIILKFYHEISSVIYVIYENGQSENVVYSACTQ